ncbi:hypothetical protein O3S80_11405 [Streptomyces sp. Lzd4kr]|nr:hypothetical protein [Streptomyces sp. Lzd4kr]
MRLAADERGLPALADFFAALVEARCSGPYARWGCMVTNAHAGAENSDLAVRAALEQHDRSLRDALAAALVAVQGRRRLASGADVAAAADLLALIAYGVKLR